MKTFGLRRLMTNIPVLYHEIEDGNDSDLCQVSRRMISQLSFVVLNPDLGTPKIDGMVYLYSLLPMANNLIVPKTLITKLTGVNSLSGDRSVDNFKSDGRMIDLRNCVKDFYTRSNGSLDPQISNWISRGDEHGLQSFCDWLDESVIYAHDLIERKKGFAADQAFLRYLTGLKVEFDR